MADISPVMPGISSELALVDGTSALQLAPSGNSCVRISIYEFEPQMQPKAKMGDAYRPTGENIEPPGKSQADADARALRERLISEQSREQMSDAAAAAERLAKLREVVRRFDTLPILDDREPDEIIGYDKDGLPT